MMAVRSLDASLTLTTAQDPSGLGHWGSALGTLNHKNRQESQARFSVLPHIHASHANSGRNIMY